MTTNWLDRKLSAAASIVGLTRYAEAQARRLEDKVPPDGSFVNVPGARLHYVDKGNGPAIVMIHGLGGQLRNFSYDLLDRLTDRYRVILVDRPGSGYSTADEGTAPGVIAQGAIIAAFISALKLKQPVVVGHSMGGAIGLALALDYPHLVSSLVLLAPLSQKQGRAPKAFGGLMLLPDIARQTFAETVGAPLSKLASDKVLTAIFAPEVVPPDFATRGGAALSERATAIAVASHEMKSANDDLARIVPRYSELAVPTAILFGRHDAVLDPKLHGTLTADQIDGATLTLIDGGHMIIATAAERVADFISSRAGA